MASHPEMDQNSKQKIKKVFSSLHLLVQVTKTAEENKIVEK